MTSIAHFISPCQIDSHLTWRNHIEVCSVEITELVTMSTEETEIFSGPKHSPYSISYHIVMSHLSYGIEVWGVAAHINLQKLFVMQKRAQSMD